MRPVSGVFIYSVTMNVKRTISQAKSMPKRQIKRGVCGKSLPNRGVLEEKNKKCS